MKITRTVHPIGQGGFYTEEFNGGEYRVVYDCGGNSEKSMNNYLSKYAPKSKNIKIDAIFISHLHSDHINGLQYLLKNANVIKLFLPQMNDCMKFEIWLNYKLYFEKNNPGLLNLLTTITDDKQTQINDTHIIRVNFENENSSINFDDDPIDLNEFPDTTTIDSGKILYLKKANEDIKWLYIPYNPQVPNNKCFSNHLKSKLGISKLGPADVPDLIKNNGIAAIKAIYRDYFHGNHNSYSMTLFSGLKNPECYIPFDFHYLNSFMFCPDLYCCFHHCEKAQEYTPNCLYTGDFDVTFLLDLIKFYRPLWKTIKTIQVPHHGSRYNYKRGFYLYPIKGFISAGVKNNYRHPHTDTLTKIGKNKCIPIIVTEDEKTKYEEFISI